MEKVLLSGTCLCNIFRPLPICSLPRPLFFQSDYCAQVLLDEVDDFRERLLRLKIYDEISIPLVYTQVCLFSLASMNE